MDIALWVLQVLLALAFGMAGLMKMTTPYEKLGQQMAWVKSLQPSIVKLIGLLEFLGALGLILPGLTHILPILTPVAAAGLVLTMIGAAVTHIQLKENDKMVAPLVLGVLVLIVAIGRFAIVPLV